MESRKIVFILKMAAGGRCLLGNSGVNELKLDGSRHLEPYEDVALIFLLIYAPRYIYPWAFSHDP